MKTLSLLKACFTQDMNMFKYSAKKESSKLTKKLFPIMLFILVSLSIGTYAYVIAKELYTYDLTYIMLSMFIFMVTIITFMEGIYKSQGILFEARDNDLLFSLPIKKSQILLVRIIKLLVFQFIYNLMFILPAFAIYIYFEKPSINFYIISIIMGILIPIIPTIVSSILGYLVKLVSSKFKSKKIIQTLLSSFIFLFIFFLSMNADDFIKNIASKATSINDLLTNIYYPIGLYINLITKFKLLDLIKILLINIIPFLLFILLGSKLYFKIIFSSKENIKRKKKLKKGFIVKQKPIISLIKKELKRYFSSVVYMFNTSFGLILAVIVPIILGIKGQDVFDSFLSGYGVSGNLSLSVIFYFFILFVGAMTSISSSSISLEGKTINITKSLPISEKIILQSKILTCFVIELPFIMFSDILFFIMFKPSLSYVLLIMILSFVVILLTSCIGLIANLKYPKMNASNDTEVVKQSMSAMIGVFSGMGILIVSILLVAYLNSKISILLLLGIHVILLFIISIILYLYLVKYGIKEYKKINV